MRTTCSTVLTKILPSPILPVRAALTMASMAPSTRRIGNDDLDLHLGQEINHVLGPTIEFGVALLAAESLDLGHGQAGDANLRQRFTHFVELEWFDDRFNFFHGLGSREDRKEIVSEITAS
jgi:hypothetical protein